MKKTPLQGQALGLNVKDATLVLQDIPVLSDQVIGRTNLGKGRDKNQDAISAYAWMHDQRPMVVLSVADGLGSYFYAEGASFEAVTQIPRGLSVGENFDESFGKCHRFLLRGFPYQEKNVGKSNFLYPKKRNKNDLGATTLVLAYLDGDLATLAWVGDSRIYLIRNGRLFFKTRDQSMGELLRLRSDIHEEALEGPHHQLRSLLLNALGSPESHYEWDEAKKTIFRETGLPIVETLHLEKGDFLFLATDGFFTNISEEVMVPLVIKTPWEQLNEALHQTMQVIFNNENPTGKVTLDNYSYIVYRHF